MDKPQDQCSRHDLATAAQIDAALNTQSARASASLAKELLNSGVRFAVIVRVLAEPTKRRQRSD